MANSVPYLDIKRTHAKILPQLEGSLERVVNSGRVVLGKELSEFEELFAQFCGVKYAIGVANGLDALILSLMSLGVSGGDEVIVPSNTYIATLLAVSRVGATIVLVEPKIDTYNIDPSKIEKAITKKTKVIIPVHLYGQACEMEPILKIAKKYHLFVLEDNAQAHGAAFKGKKTGSFGIVNATSFYPGKNLGALGDGGGITTQSRKVYERVKLLRDYGSPKKYYHETKGYNSRLDELQASFLKIKLKFLKENNKKRQKLAKKYINELEGTGDLVLPITEFGSTHVYHIFAIRTKKRDKLMKYLTSRKIGNLMHYPIPPHLQKAYRDLGFKKGDFPLAEELAATSVSIPIFPEMRIDEQEYIIRTIKNFYA